MKNVEEILLIFPVVTYTCTIKKQGFTQKREWEPSRRYNFSVISIYLDITNSSLMSASAAHLQSLSST